MPNNIVCVSLRAMREEEFEAFAKWSVGNYAQELLLAGQAQTEAAALRQARADFEGLLPDGIGTKNQFLTVIVAPGAGDVGVLWYQFEENGGVFLCDFAVSDTCRRRGYGFAALSALDRAAAEAGACAIGLHVFAYNEPAYRLYIKAGFTVVRRTENGSVFMRKELPCAENRLIGADGKSSDAGQEY